AKVASGGELSRVALAVALACSGARAGSDGAGKDAEAGPGTLIFDEVDAGIGGGTAVEVGRLLQRLAGRSQVLCVTHLAQVAAHADWNCRIDKLERTGGSGAPAGVVSRAQLLQGDERSAEIARMLGATRLGAAAEAGSAPRGALDLADSMLREARAGKLA
ncbi:MAG: hypothetical protein N2544_17795, partial [Burkholderiales bacterium]|nr:hypothetical protein [Burkholderiales bacterium]